MNSLVTLVHGIGIAYAAGVNLYATVAITGLAVRLGWLTGAPSAVSSLGKPWVIATATLLFAVEFVATMIPGIASAWETVHSLIRPPAAAILSAAIAWQADPVIVLVAALLGGGIAITVHTTKLGLRYAIDASPEPATNGLANFAELLLVASIVIAIWRHPFITLLAAVSVLAGMVLTVRLIWRTLRQVVSGHWMPAQGLMQAPRVAEPRAHLEEEEEEE